MMLMATCRCGQPPPTRPASCLSKAGRVVASGVELPAFSSVHPTHVHCRLPRLPVSPSRWVLRAASSSPSRTNWPKGLTLRDTGRQVRQRTRGQSGAHVTTQAAVQTCGVDVGPALRPARRPGACGVVSGEAMAKGGAARSVLKQTVALDSIAHSCLLLCYEMAHFGGEM